MERLSTCSEIVSLFDCFQTKAGLKRDWNITLSSGSSSTINLMSFYPFPRKKNIWLISSVRFNARSPQKGLLCNFLIGMVSNFCHLRFNHFRNGCVARHALWNNWSNGAVRGFDSFFSILCLFKPFSGITPKKNFVTHLFFSFSCVHWHLGILLSQVLRKRLSAGFEPGTSQSRIDLANHWTTTVSWNFFWYEWKFQRCKWNEAEEF